MRSTRARLDRVPSGLPTSRYEFRRQPVNVLIDTACWASIAGSRMSSGPRLPGPSPGNQHVALTRSATSTNPLPDHYPPLFLRP